MSSSDGSLSRVLTVALLIMVLISTPVGAMGYQSPSAVSSLSVEGDDARYTATEYIGCIEFVGDGITQCSGSVENEVQVEQTLVPTLAAGMLKLQVDVSVTSGFRDSQYVVEARADDGAWAERPLRESESLSVENSYRSGSIQFPTLSVRVRDTTTGEIVALNSERFGSKSPVVIPSGDSNSFFDGVESVQDSISNPKKGATVVGNDQREVLNPTYSSVARFNDGDGAHESFEDKSLPPVRYDASGLKVSGPEGNILFFDNLRENSSFPAIFRHSEGQMHLGTALYGLPGADFQKLRIDYALQTETKQQTVRVSLVNRYGEPIDPQMENDPARTLGETTGQGSAYFDTNQQYANALYEDNINTETAEIVLSDEERQYIAENNEIYVTYSTNNRAYLLLYRSPVISQSTYDQQNENFVPDVKYFEKDFNQNPGGEETATFDASYRILGQLNDQYESFDRVPGENLDVQVTVRNDGNSRVERRVGIYSMSDQNVSLYGEENAEAKTIDKRVVGVEPHSSKTFKVEFNYGEHEFGYHNVTVLDTTDEDNPTRIARSRDNEEVSRVYVLQPATFEVTNVVTPDSWLKNDNFNTTVVVRNVGDLAGTGVIHGEFQSWEGDLPIPETAGGNVRANSDGGFQNVTFDRQGYDYSPESPARPANGDDSNRPISPYGAQLTYADNNRKDDGDTVDVESKFNATTTHPFATSNEKLYNLLKHSKESDTVRIYNLDIITLKVDGERKNGGTWYASGSPQISPTASEYWSAWVPATDYDILGQPIQQIPTVSGSNVIYPLYEVGNSQNKLDVTVTVRNDGQAHVGTARVEVRTDGQGINKNLAGASGATDIGPWETKTLRVPTVIRNEFENGGVHTLSVHPWTSEDYIQQLGRIDATDTSGANQFETTVNIDLWADFLHQETAASDYTINEQCTGNRPSDMNGEEVLCAADKQETFEFTQTHKNVGGEAGDLTVDAFIRTWTDPSGGSHYSSFGSVSDPVGSAQNHWVAQSQHIAPHTSGVFTATDIPLDEPGIYVLQSEPHRVNYEGDLNNYNSSPTTVPQTEWQYIKVLDITDPESHAFISDTSYECKSGVCMGSDGSWTVWEGATVEFNNESVDNVVVDRLQWGGVGYNGGLRNCHGADHCYSEAGLTSDNTADRPVHRFDDAGTYDIALQVWDHPAYGAGAPVNGDGTPNTDTDSWTLNVKADTNNPSANIRVSDTNNPDGSPDADTIWKSYSGTNYDGIEVCFSTTASDSEIGIEADDWTGVSGGANEDDRCRTWSSDGSKTVTYDVWDFAGNKATDEATLTVETDTVDPSVSLSGHRSAQWVDKAYYSSSVTWRGSASDDETGLRNCPYDWSGDTNGDASTCSDNFKTSYSSASESGTAFDVTFTAEDFHGNTKSTTESVTLYEDKTAPSVTGDTKECSADSTQNGCSVTVCVDYSDNGPFGGIGIHHTEGAGGDGCVTASANANADANADAPMPSSCGETNYDEDWDSDTDSESVSATVTVYDKHGNSASAHISASASDYDEDTDTDSTSSDPCPTPTPTPEPCTANCIEQRIVSLPRGALLK